ncbi:TIGR00282 family metallophosphoesterase [Haploplasma axanthum]|uniref:Putative metallophosphoesterase n=1 Tax=Haploplasma axanthum TaxID=29552 RepID=A0A449BE01_HAPAX|nr:TIGR00282 family metallophosphoesterase [Haploplasma axanthum]VEU80683.1 putative metallophosphoesterase [Haploplasma axanthum]
MKILFIGDIYGDPGIEILKDSLEELKKEYRPNVIIINGENIVNGRGINKKIYLEIMKLGVHAITMGNWTWSNTDIYSFINDSKIVRPANYLNAPGDGYKKININGKNLLVINAMGRVYMNPSLENPFITIAEILEKEQADYTFIDFHAEATSEKVALGHYFDGKVDAIVGTHTHVQTNDARVLPKGTLYITDVGMTGPRDGVIGVDKEIVIQRFLTGFSYNNAVASGVKQLNGVFLDLDKKIIKTIHIEK